MRIASAIMVIGFALAGAVYFDHLKLGSSAVTYDTPVRASWQLPVAVLIVFAGLALAALILVWRKPS